MPLGGSRQGYSTFNRPYVKRHHTGRHSLAASFLSLVHDNGDADDEHSPSEHSARASSIASNMARQPQYHGEDVRPTSAREIAGWYSYGWAAEVFPVCGVGSFIPIVLEQMARENGYLLDNPSQRCVGAPNTPSAPGSNGTALATTFLSRASDRELGDQCIVQILGLHINTASFAMYTFSLSVLVQALVVVTMSGFADHGTYRKLLLLNFAVVGAGSTMMFLPLTPSLFLLGSLLAVISNTCFGASSVLLNSFLPLLVRHHPRAVCDNTAIAQVADGDARDEDGVQDPTVTLLPPISGMDEPDVQRSGDSPTIQAKLQLMTKLSANGTGLGYTAAILVQIGSVLLVVKSSGSLFSLKLVLFVVGIWWITFSIPAAIWLRPRPGPPLLAAHMDDATGHRSRIWGTYLSHSWRSLGRTVIRARRLKDMLLFLSAWFLLSDGVATVSGTAVLYAKTTLHMEPGALAMINVVAMLFAVFGAFAWRFVSHRFGLSPNKTILACVGVFEIIPIYALLGYLPIPIGLKSPWEVYPVAALYGIVLGGVASYCRAIFGELIPPGSEAAFYALYAITDKGSSVFGPIVVGAITDATGEIRPAFLFLAVLVGLPIPLLALVDVDRGRREAAALAQDLVDAEGRDSSLRSQIHVSETSVDS